MAKPIRYIPQVIPTDFGNLAIQSMQNRQNQYDTAYSNMIQADDQFGQFQVDPSDIEGKNTILGNFKERTQQIVDKYGGDYAAAAKDLAREVVTARSNPFFQLATYKNQLAEEERRKIDTLGPNAIVIKSVSNTPVLGKDNKVVGKEQLQSKIYDKRAIQQDLANAFGRYGAATREEYVGSKLPGYQTKQTHVGLLPSEVAGKTQEAMQYLKNTYSDVPEQILSDMATNYISSLVGGTKSQELADRRLEQEGQGLQNAINRVNLNIKKKQFEALGNPQQPPKVNTDHLVSGGEPVSGYTGNMLPKLKTHREAVSKFNKAATDIPRLKQEIAKDEEALKKYKNQSAVEYLDSRFANTAESRISQLTTAIADKKRKLAQARVEYVSAENLIGKEEIDRYVKAGVPKPEAINLMSKQLEAKATSGSATITWNNKADESSTVKHLADFRGTYSVIDNEGKEITGTGGLYKRLVDKDSKITKIGYNMDSGSMAIQLKVKKGDNYVNNTIFVPLYDMDSNEAVKNTMTLSNNIRDISRGLQGLGYFVLDPTTGEPEHYQTLDELKKANPAEGQRIIEVAYDKTGKKINSQIVARQGNTLSTRNYNGEPFTVEDFDKEAMVNIGSYFGEKVTNIPKKESEQDSYLSGVE